MLLACLAAAVALVLSPLEEDAVAEAVVRPARALAAMPVVPPPAKLSPPSERGGNDPFAARQWRAPPPVAAPPVPPPPPAPVAAPVAAPAGPPALPYKFVGQMEDAGRVVVYLGQGEQVVLARQGETLDGQYKVVSIDPRQITFEYLPAGTIQVLSIPASQ